MTRRDRLILLVVPPLAVLAAGWVLVVAPERQKAAKLAPQVSAATSQLAEAESQVASARSAQARYASAYASIVNLGLPTR